MRTRAGALATHLHARHLYVHGGGELEALEWNSVDFEHGYILIDQSANADTVPAKSTKTKDVRKVPIEKEQLLPLLRRCTAKRARVAWSYAAPGRVGGTTAKVPRLVWGQARGPFRRRRDAAPHLVPRPSAHGITWRALRGDDPLKIQRAAGHDDLKTTQRYINEAQTFEGQSFGEPFPGVPLPLLSIYGSNSGFMAVENGPKPLFFSHQTASPAGFEPALAT